MRREWKGGLEEIAPNAYAYTQPHGELGVSNAGFLLDNDGGLAVDALLVPSMTRRFLEAIRKITTRPVSQLINTHHHVDHVGGSFLFEDAQIISHVHAREELLKSGLPPVPALKQLIPAFADEYDQLKTALPQLTFEKRMVIHRANHEAELRHLGPAHTFGDALVYLAKEKVVFAGDIAFFQVTPLAYQGHVGSWIKVANRILKMDVDIIVPGHGPIGTKREMLEMRKYLVYLRREAKERFEAGIPAKQAAREIKLGVYASWREPERILPNVMRLYQEFQGELDKALNVFEVFTEMAQLRQDIEPGIAHTGHGCL
ncbi:MAG TPA: MBL fold metallo-hydrolase [Blastocatellia bacterium]|nr:MBL fold metallo-hydrolase [Blastocatellia bacterium]